MAGQIIIKQGKEKALLRKHPWVFTGAVAKIKGKPGLGDTVDVLDTRGSFLGRAAYSPHSQICARVWTFDANEQIDFAFFQGRFERALRMRQAVLPEGTTGYRLIAGESDGLPGITIDIYANWIVCQLLSAGAELQRGVIVEALRSVFPEHNVYERSDVDVRKKEGLEQVTGVLHGPTEPPADLVIEENGLKLYVDIVSGHKTGYYLDQRDARQAIKKYAKGKRVLNCFSYTGGFGLYAASAGASFVRNLDMSQPALDIAARNLELNGLNSDNVEHVQGDVFQLLRDYQSGEKFDVIVLDPPKFVDSKASLTRACRGYKDINRLAAKLLNPGGILMTFSCSGLLSAELFQKVVADGVLDAGREMQIIERTFQAADHPVSLPYPEGLYLKGLVVRLVG
ncbi:class I SAM-dependent rRNA methyltransferase [Aliidiomarina maris]|uniref:23S rRNA (Cytosine(1962)-C(5))-methyltransferase RlmI n=1 Tax=Aliidiomarina maris TaxID=531312 RepID=A0A327X159_9GAMM|nr:class I SAM-dependent methyltransferase [Aliidiomarina maris]RAJ99004.1 SAM-dependent methyltransferase /23S rRNA m(5)C-1962 methyltransferase [Aliidiomarina maris]RUO25139.1 23S rRNA (cytosine(1962)-C(5))-methyltransferase RlmI [Aliidiomarina maris]